MNRRRFTLSLAASAGGLVTAAFLSAPVVSADIDVLFTPDTSTFDPAPTSGFFEYATGTEKWNDIYIPNASQDTFDGFTTNDTFEKFGSTVNDYAVVTSFLSGPEVGSTIDYLQFGGGYANEFVYEAGTPTPLTDLFITPFGDLTLFQL
jgi:hypothetical protein